jgi:hypothetical protein
MTAWGSRLGLSLDPLIAEAKRRAHRRRLLLLLLLVAAVAAVAIGLALRTATGSGLAAVDPKPVVHVVMEEPPNAISFNLTTGHRTGGVSREEMWIDPQNRRERIVHTEGGRVVEDDVWTNRYTPRSEAAAVEHVYLGLATSYRAALRNGTDKLVGRGSFNGHRLVWLHWLQPKQHSYWEASEDVGVDANTFKPLILRFRSSREKSGGYYVPVLVAKAIAYRPADFKRHGPSHPPRPVPGQTIPGGFAFGSTNPSNPPSTVVRAPWLTAGTTVAGLKLRAVTPFTISRSKHRFYYGAPRPKPIHGLELVYGPPSYKPAPNVPPRVNVYGKAPRGRTKFTTIYEIPRAPHVSPWSIVPAGSITVQRGLTTVGNRIVRTLRIGYLRKHGLDITIRTPRDAHTALEIARSLRTGHR